MKKTIIVLVVLAIVVYAIYQALKMTAKPVTKSETTADVVANASSPSSVSSVPGTTITTTYSPAPLGNSVNEEVDVVMTGLILLNHYDFEITTDLTAFQGVEIEVRKVANNLARISIKNTNTTTITLPTLTISALKLN